MAPQIAAVSAERIAEELRKILKHPNRERGVRLLAEVGLVEHILPEKSGEAGVWDLAFAAMAGLPTESKFELAFATLLVGCSGKAVKQLCRRLRLSNDESERIEWLVTHCYALRHADRLANHLLFPILAHPGHGDLLTLFRVVGHDPAATAFVERWLRDHPPETFNPPPLITGDDLKDMGLKPGPLFKKLLDEIRTLQLDGVLKIRREAEEKIRERVGQSQQD
jgi:poly(A) polymerase